MNLVNKLTNNFYNMTQENILKEAAKLYGSGKPNSVLAENAFIAGAKLYDKNPNKELVYTKKELLNIGFGFDLNCKI